MSPFAIGVPRKFVTPPKDCSLLMHLKLAFDQLNFTGDQSSNLLPVTANVIFHIRGMTLLLVKVLYSSAPTHVFVFAPSHSYIDICLRSVYLHFYA